MMDKIAKIKAEIERRITSKEIYVYSVREYEHLLSFIDSIEDESIILTEEILKKNGFDFNPPPRYKYPYWSKLFTASDGRCYHFQIHMEQGEREILMTVMPLASNDGPKQPTCYLPHPKFVYQLQDSLNLFNIPNIIKV